MFRWSHTDRLLERKQQIEPQVSLIGRESQRFDQRGTHSTTGFQISLLISREAGTESNVRNEKCDQSSSVFVPSVVCLCLVSRFVSPVPYFEWRMARVN